MATAAGRLWTGSGSTTMAAVEPNSTPMRTANRARFELELEFVQALANPFYLENLASEGLLEDQAFINYLQYLQYWRKSEYARFIVYPHCLHFLELLQHEQFRNELKNPLTRMRLEHYQFEHWRTWYVPIVLKLHIRFMSLTKLHLGVLVRFRLRLQMNNNP
ncbi:unnamed protein product [Rhizoctonia solani]|uniref:Mediator of RNA polymerase II transcription subunit 31 n=1 Tax=Rhizoctonia solani TaxID=456999 RepID=A0A8H2X5D3_9AGAM|nr:unnamed protein product [Rhizoctonia solani]